MKRILVPTDFSLPSTLAYSFALKLAAATDAIMFAVHVIELPLLQETTFGIQPFASDPQFAQQVEKRAQEAFARLSGRHPSDREVHFQAIQGDIIRTLADFVRTHDIDLVVMSPRGESDINDFFIGSTAARIVRYSTVPVLFVPTGTEIGSIRNIVFPNPLYHVRRELVDAIKYLQEIFHASLHILLVNTPEHFLSDRQSRERLEAFAAEHHLINYTLNCRNHPHESQAIAAFVDEIPGSLLAMETHGRKGIAHLIRGSIAESMVTTMSVPVWVSKSQPSSK